MPDTDKDKDWARAFALQALSDLKARDVLESAKVEKCHRLPFLQMAAEKLCKAYLIEARGHENVRRTHAYIQKYLPVIAREAYSRMGNGQSGTGKLKSIRQLAREIEILAPACEDGESRPDNSEYPWEDRGGLVQTPCQYEFPEIYALEKEIVPLIRTIQFSAKKYI